MIMRNCITSYYAFIVVIICFQHHLVASPSPNNQKTALFQFKQSLNISTSTICYYYNAYSYSYTYETPSYPKTMDWSMSSDYCTWVGVSCEHMTGNVIGLDLSCSQLEGAILPNSTLFQLSYLRFLDLSNNDFSLSNEFPQEFGFFAKGLTHLNLSRTRFSGRVPSGISHLHKLVLVDLNYNYGAKLEDEVFKLLLQNLTQLRVLNVEGVDISSVLPMNLSSSLEVLNLGNTGVYGASSGISHLYKLVSLDLSYNYGAKLENKVFKSLLQNLTQLRVLNLGFVNINSVLPMNMSSSLEVLNLGNTGLYGVSSGISQLHKLVSLDLSENYGAKLEDKVFKSLLQNLTHLRVLNLKEVNIFSVLPMNTALYGVLPEEVFHLPNIEFLTLGSTTNYGETSSLKAVLPKVKWGSSATLQHLFLYGINFHHGGIPDSIGFLESLANLGLWNCNLSGVIPRSIGNLGQLTLLDLGGNNFNGPIPINFANLTILRQLSLSYNNFSGPLPSFVAHFKGLVNLDLSHNGLTGLLPPWLFKFSSLERLNLGYNRFKGQLYEFDSSKSKLQSFSQLINLTLLDFSLNNFSGVLDMKMFSRLESLNYLDLSHNGIMLRNTSMVTLPPKLYHLGLSSCDMKEFPRFSRDAEISLDYVDLSNNDIDGEIPHWIGSVRRYLNISHNRLTGGLEQLPWNSIQYLDLQSNKLNGSLLRSICNSSSLEVLNLSHNKLSGVLPSCQTNLARLSVFDLRMNSIHGKIPANLSNFRFLETINLNGNKLGGKVPSSFAEFDYLQVLDLGNNLIKDTFPQCLEALPNLQVLVLKSNKFYGMMNKSSEVEHPFRSLRIIDLSYNDFSGTLPTMYFKSFMAMMNGHLNETKPEYMGDDSYSDSTTLVIKGLEIELIRILTVFTTIDVSKNNFEGEIAEYIGNLASLRFLNLSHNHLTGHIPASIAKLTVLESLDLSSNQLKGEIPHQLTDLYSLAILNLSFNQLKGEIPQGFQFNTFENDSYVGNLGLCGKPLSQKCGHDNVTQEEDEEEDDDYFFGGFTWEAVVIGYVCGVVPAFIAGYLMLLARKPKWFAGIIARELGLKVRRMEIKWR
ncbi:uncharacterized protein LOC141670661 [Apium graveolens]|uniref:uncharacterized protein LOC141670661 n=1 Tax=Apium graveolens TaxID=4045 RepID=UPI003D7A26BA